MKKVGIGLVVLIVLFIVVGFFLPGEVSIVRTVEINRPPAQVFQQVNELRNWQNWSAWYKMEPSAEWDFSEPSYGQDAWYTWKGEQVGSGKLTLKEVEPKKSIKTQLEFEGEDPADGAWSFEETEAGTKVSWTFHTSLGSMPHTRWMGLLMESFLGPQLEQGLNDMKSHVEALPELPNIEVNKVEKNPKPAVTTRQTASMAQISDAMASMYAELMVEIASSGLEPDGMPYAIYHQMGDEVDFTCGIPVRVGEGASANAELGVTPSGTYYTTIMKGPYSGLEDVHSKMQQWAQAMEIEFSAPSLEWYLNDPMEVPETEIMTEISYPAK